MDTFTEMPQFNLQKVIIDGLEVEAYLVVPNDTGQLAISFFTSTEEQQKKVISLSDACFHKKEVEFTMCHSQISRVSKIRSVGSSADEEIGLNHKNYKVIKKCTVVFDLEYQDYKNSI